MNDRPGMDDLPVLTDVVVEEDALPILTEVIEETSPAATRHEAMPADPAANTSSALQAYLEQLLVEKLQARLAAAQQAVIAEVLAELKAELPELIRHAPIPPRS